MQNTKNQQVMTTIAKQRIQEWRNLGMNNQSIINLVNGMMMNKINSKNMLLCLEIKKQLKLNIMKNQDMTEQINNTENKTQMTKDEIYIADSIINIIHRYSNISNEGVSKQMLKDIIGHCQSLQQIY